MMSEMVWVACKTCKRTDKWQMCAQEQRVAACQQCQAHRKAQLQCAHPNPATLRTTELVGRSSDKQVSFPADAAFAGKPFAEVATIAKLEHCTLASICSLKW